MRPTVVASTGDQELNKFKVYKLCAVEARRRVRRCAECDLVATEDEESNKFKVYRLCAVGHIKLKYQGKRKQKTSTALQLLIVCVKERESRKTNSPTTPHCFCR